METNNIENNDIILTKKEKQRQYYIKNKEVMNLRAREFYLKNKEQMIINSTQRRKDNKEAYNIQVKERYQKKQD